MSNRLVNETSPYLVQHKDNPVDWYPWCKEAFEKAAREDKPVFLSIGYSACHWCHVLAHESFEDTEIAEILNKYFVSVKVDKEERPDIDSVYMSVCQAFTGSGGWPTSIFMTADKKPFFAGTYFPKTSRDGMIGFRELILAISEKWEYDRDVLLWQAEEIIKHLKGQSGGEGEDDRSDLPHLAAEQFKRIFDTKNGGFGRAPKFPTPHNLMFLLEYYRRKKDDSCLNMAEHTLLQMYRGGIFDHIGFGFCRYSTDDRFLVPHFEKMLYDNALLVTAYCDAYALTKQPLYLEVAEKTAGYILKEMTCSEGGFFSSQDADSEGEEGKYYLFTPEEIIGVLGQEEGERFCRRFDITEEGNFEGRNIPNLLKSELSDRSFEAFLPQLDDFRKKRYSLHRDEKVLCSWNGLMIAALCRLYLLSQKETYLSAAKNANGFVQKHLCDKETLFVSYHSGRRGVKGFLDDYAAYILSQLSLYRATLEEEYLSRAEKMCRKVLRDFSSADGGFYLYGDGHEELILRPKETYDGAIPSGNSIMCYNLVYLHLLTERQEYAAAADKQIAFLSKNASDTPMNHAMFLRALMDYRERPVKITVSPDARADKAQLARALPQYAVVLLLSAPNDEYPLINGKTTYYVCRGHSCLPPTNEAPLFTEVGKGR